MFMSWKILISDTLAQEGIDILNKLADVKYNPTISSQDLLSEISSYDALVVRGRTKVTQEVITSGSKLKVIGRAGVGVDNIDLEFAKEKGIIVVNTPTATTNAVAELTLATMLTLARHIAKADSSMKSGEWNKKAFKGFELSGKTLGIIGMGRIGSRVAKFSQAFDMNVIGHDSFLSDEHIASNYAKPVKLDVIYKQSDFITLHLPLNNDTKKMINEESISSMKKGVHIICVARGGIIDESALLKYLNNGHISGAALDVFETEPPGLTDIVSHPNVLTTPHIGAQTNEAQIKAATDMGEEILNALNDNPLRWRIV